MRTLLLYIILFTTLTVSAETDTVSVAIKDTITLDTLHTDREATDTLKQKKRKGFFWKAYYFLDKVLSPERDKRYIDVQDYNWCAMMQLSMKFESYKMSTNDGQFNIRVAPTPHLRVGPFFGWRFAFLGYNLDLKSLLFTGGDIDLGGSIYSAAFGCDLFYRRVGGNFKIKTLESNGQDYSDLLHGQSFDGIHLGMTRISLYYVPNFRRYSHQAAFSQTHRQLISAGSMILGLQYAHNTSSIDYKALKEKIEKINPGVIIPESVSQGEEKNDEISATVGYGYNWVFHKNWLLGTEITGGIGFLIQNDKVNTEEENSIRQQLNKHVAINGTLRFSLLYNNGPLYTGLQGVGFYYQHGNAHMVSRNFLATVYVMLGYNF